MPTSLNLNEDGEPITERRRARGRRQDDNRAASLVYEFAKVVFPTLLAIGIGYCTAVDAAKTEIAVVKEREGAHFEEIQRTLRRIDEWISRQENKGR